MYKSLQGGRAIAAMLVVLFHLGEAVAAKKYFGIAAFSIPFKFGSAGIELFFVLSGFIIFSSHSSDLYQPGKLADYIKKRFVRIFPTYWIVFFVVFFLATLSSSLRNTVPHDIFVLAKSLFLIPQDKNIVGGSGAPVIIVAWTLQYEILFYLLFGALFFSKWISVTIGGSLFVIYIYINYNKVLLFPLSFLAQDYILLFVMGMVVSLVCTSKKIVVNSPKLYTSAGALMFLLVALDLVMNINFLVGWRTILYGLAGGLMVFGLVQAEDKNIIIFGNRWLQILGDSSYALYLIHYPLISIMCKLALLVSLNKHGLTGALIAYFAIFYVCLTSSVIFHLKIEKPVVAYFQSRLTNRAQI